MRKLALLALALFISAAPATAHELNPDEVKDLALEAILENPEIIMQAVALLEQRNQIEQAEAAAAALNEHRAVMEQNDNAPVLGNPDGDVTLVEFFDYNCPYCRRAGDALRDVLAEDANLRVVYWEIPILGEESVIAARASLAARAQGKYEEMHWAMMGLESRVNAETAIAVAAELGMDTDKLQADMFSAEVETHLAASMQLAQDLGITGTPAFVIGSQLIPGVMDAGQMRELIAAERAAN